MLCGGKIFCPLRPESNDWPDFSLGSYDAEFILLGFRNLSKMEEPGEGLEAEVARSCATNSWRNEATQEIIIAAGD